MTRPFAQCHVFAYSISFYYLNKDLVTPTTEGYVNLRLIKKANLWLAELGEYVPMTLSRCLVR